MMIDFVLFSALGVFLGWQICRLFPSPDSRPIGRRAKTHSTPMSMKMKALSGVWIDDASNKFRLCEYYCDAQYPCGPPHRPDETAAEREEREKASHAPYARFTPPRGSPPLPEVTCVKPELFGDADASGGKRVSVRLADGAHVADMRCGVEGCAGWIRRRDVA